MNTVLETHFFTATTRFEIVLGDLTQEPVDAIVNAANVQLAHGGGVAAAIVRAGGEKIQQESDAWVREHGAVTHDEPAYTSAGQMTARYVIHAVGPIWGEGEEDRKLEAAVQGSLRRAEALGLESIAFPAISTGIYGFPRERAAHVFMKAFLKYFAANPSSPLRLVRLTLRDGETAQIFIDAAGAALQPPAEHKP
jgi:O-acetyl-ADP-ribose deacetylase (regulator of RNase III)